jgi:transcriptional regulator with XRE-family HTH domain
MPITCEFCAFLRYRSSVRWTPEAIRQQRESRGWTQPELAEALGVSPRSISSWEAGTARPRNITSLNRLLGDGDMNDEQEVTLAEASPAELVAELLRRIGSLERIVANGVISGGGVNNTGVHIRYLPELPPDVIAQSGDEVIGERSGDYPEQQSVHHAGEEG